MFHPGRGKQKIERRGGNYRSSLQILNILGPMMMEFKREISEMRAKGASEIEIDAMLDELETHYATDDAEGKLVLAVLREAARLPAPGSVSP